ncbi:helix-turn-helix domain-containing protein [Halomarina oriensis]|uniref:MarR family transcriptional regulator n=1 Tax=Halomarina oriensis TaxID=671145 RepID=A0A6B0GRV3_9EURY|nr:helix-turn-helix domain-containing protein [Halomarina oriensis]MWG34805.1 MarR family transcriptional regulator [Halomarina oriensis]
MSNQPMPLRVDDKTEAVLDAFQTHGYATTGYLVEQTGLTRPTLGKRLDRLYTAGCIDYVHEPTAFWILKNDPRDTEDTD